MLTLNCSSVQMHSDDIIYAVRNALILSSFWHLVSNAATFFFTQLIPQQYSYMHFLTH